MRAFLAACAVVLVIGVACAVILNAVAQKPAWAAFATPESRNTPPADPQQ
jgi:hypothetical protein